VYDGRDDTRKFVDWDTRAIYGAETRFDVETIRTTMAQISKDLLGIDPLNEDPGIKFVVEGTDKTKENWLYLNHKMSAIDFLHEFVKITDGIISIFPMIRVRGN
jgi:hypothetical protein